MGLVSKKTCGILLACAAILMVLVGFWLPAIAQPTSYHHFADQRSWLGVPKVLNVLSNGALVLVGVWGLFLLFSKDKVSFIKPQERWFWTFVAIGLVLTGFGSAYYHLAPNNERLIWDRMGIVIIMMSYTAALIGERLNIRLGLTLWPILLALGFLSVWLWYASELKGSSDLRFYGGVQVFAVVTTLILLLGPSLYTRSIDLMVVVFLFGLARLCEMQDHQVYQLTQGLVSGHTLKHLLLAMAGGWLMYMIWKRKEKR